MRRRLGALQARVPQIGDVRGLGAMLALEFVRDPPRESRTRRSRPAPSSSRSQRGLILLKAGLHGNVIRNLAPLTLTDDQLDEALGVLEGAIVEASAPVTAA